MRSTFATRVAVAAVLAAAAAPALAQPYQPSGQGAYAQGTRAQGYSDGYRAGYRAGYDAGRTRARYDDQLPGSAYGGDASQRWRHRYGQVYSYNDDRFYQECRNQPDPAGVLVGALIGGLLGSSASRGGGRTGGTIAGVIVGGALGAGLTQHLQCQDRSYAYKTYYDAFNSGRPHSNWQWDNPGTGNYGDFRVGDYYSDPDGFRCANYTQQVWIDGRPEAMSGHACQQPDGTWAIVD